MELGTITEFAYNKYTEKTGCPSLRTILAFQDKSESMDIVPSILTFTDVERISRTLDHTGMRDKKTGKRIELGKSFLPANLNYQLFLYKFYDIAIPNPNPNGPDFIQFSKRTESGIEIKNYSPSPKNNPNIPSKVLKVPDTPREFFQVYREMKREGIDAILRCIGTLKNTDFAFNISKGEGFRQYGDALEDIMTSPNKPILIDLVPESRFEEFKREAIERWNRKISTVSEEQIMLSGADYSHQISRLHVAEKPELIRYILPYNSENARLIQLLLAEKFVNFLSNMHAQVPTVQAELAEQKANLTETERIKKNTIIQHEKEVEKAKKAIAEVKSLEEAKKTRRFRFPIML